MECPYSKELSVREMGYLGMTFCRISILLRIKFIDACDQLINDVFPYIDQNQILWRTKRLISLKMRNAVSGGFRRNQSNLMKQFEKKIAH